MLKHDLKMGDTIQIGPTKIRISKKSGQICTLVIDAPADVVITLPPKSPKKQEDQAAQEDV